MDKVTLKLEGHLVSVFLAGDCEHGLSIRPWCWGVGGLGMVPRQVAF